MIPGRSSIFFYWYLFSETNQKVGGRSQSIIRNQKTEFILSVALDLTPCQPLFVLRVLFDSRFS